MSLGYAHRAKALLGWDPKERDLLGDIGRMMDDEAGLLNLG